MAAWKQAVGLVLAVGLLYAHGLDNSFHYDDHHAILANHHLRDVGRIPAYFADPATFSRQPEMAMYRPLLQTSLALNYAVGGYEPAGYRLVNVLLHGLSAWVVCLLLQAAGARGAVAWWGGLLFAVHPIHTQAVNYISSRSEVAMGLAVLAAFYLWVTRRPAYAVALPYAAGLLCKSAAVVLLPLLGLAQSTGPWGRRPWRDLLPVGGATLVFVGLIVNNGFLPRSLAQDVRPLDSQLLTQTKALVYYVYLAVVPVRLSVEHNLLQAGRLDAAVGAALALIGSLAYCAWRSRRQWAGLGLLWFGAGLGLTFVMPLNVLVNEHRLYVSMAGAVWLLFGLYRGGGMGRRLRPWGLGLVAVLALLSWQRTRVWSDEYSLWTDAVAKAPDSFRAQSNAGLALYGRGHNEAAAQALQRALELNPNYARAWNNLGLVHEAAGRPDQAISAYKRALNLDPRLGGVHANLGRLYLAAGDEPAAASQLRQAVAVDSLSAEAYVHLGRLYQGQGKTQKAEAAYRRAVALAPKMAAAHNNLGLFLGDSGRLAEGIARLEHALRLAPDYTEAAINLALMQAQRDGYQPEAAYRQVLQRYPEQARVWKALGDLLAKQGRWPEAVDAYQEAAQRGGAVLVLLARAQWQDGQRAAAIATYRQAVGQSPDDAQIHNDLAVALAAEGRLAEALAAARQARQLAPDNPRYRRNLERLEAAFAE